MSHSGTTLLLRRALTNLHAKEDITMRGQTSRSGRRADTIFLLIVICGHYSSKMVTLNHAGRVKPTRIDGRNDDDLGRPPPLNHQHFSLRPLGIIIIVWVRIRIAERMLEHHSVCCWPLAGDQENKTEPLLLSGGGRRNKIPWFSL